MSFTSYRRSTSNAYTQAQRDPNVSPAQVKFIEGLVSERLGLLGMADLTEARIKLNLAEMSKVDASTIIERLKGMPKDPDTTMPEVVANSVRNGKGNRPGRCSTCGHTVAADAGYYYLATDGKWAVHHRVGDCSTAPAPTPVVVTEGIYVVDQPNGNMAQTIVLVYRTGNMRLAGKVWTGRSYIYRQGAVNVAAMGRPITWQEAAAIGVTSGCCVACARDLTDGRSTEVGYGPVCAKKYGWPWG